MRSPGFDACPVFEPHGSRALTAAIALAHAGGAIALLVSALPWPGVAVALVAVSASAWRAFARGKRVVRLVRRADGRWAATRRDGRVFIGTLQDDSFIHPQLVIVGLADGWRRLFVPVARDALGATEHRRLRVWVKWSPTTASAAAYRFPGTL